MPSVVCLCRCPAQAPRGANVGGASEGLAVESSWSCFIAVPVILCFHFLMGAALFFKEPVSLCSLAFPLQEICSADQYHVLQVFPLQRYFNSDGGEMSSMLCVTFPDMPPPRFSNHYTTPRIFFFCSMFTFHLHKAEALVSGRIEQAVCLNKLDHTPKTEWQQNLMTALLNTHMQTRHTIEALDKYWQARQQTYLETCLPNKNLIIKNKPVHKASLVITIICNWYKTWLET